MSLVEVHHVDPSYTRNGHALGSIRESVYLHIPVFEILIYRSTYALCLQNIREISLVVRFCMHFMVCVSGFSGIGKDEFCKRLIEKHYAIQTGLADPAKRHMADIYGFTEEQLFGPSKCRNAGDLRYPKFDRTRDSSIEEGDPAFWLSPREALQKYCGLMNELYQDTWIRKGIEDQIKIASGEYTYSKMCGLMHVSDRRCGGGYEDRPENVVTCFADFRHWHEIRLARKHRSENLLPVLVRIVSERIKTPPYDHRSETEQTTIPDSEFDFVVRNDGTVQELHDKADTVMEYVLVNKTPAKVIYL